MITPRFCGVVVIDEADPLNSKPTCAIEHLFGDQRPFEQCHASTIVCGESAQPLVAWFGGTRESHQDVSIWASHRKREISASSTDPTHHSASRIPWSAPRRIAKISNEPHWNPVLYPLDAMAGHLILHFKVGTSIRRWQTFTQSSEDAGLTWTAAKPLVDGDPRPRGAVRTKPIRLQSGHWLAGSSLERWRRWDAFFDRSPDGEGHWQATPLVKMQRNPKSGKGLIQPTLWESQPGHVHALFRSTDGWIHRSDSVDDGYTWTKTQPTLLPNNNSGIDLARLPDGLLALACNPVSGNWAARSPLSILFSKDNGIHWTGRLDIETEPGEFSYPALIATDEGIALSYTWNRRRIAFASISRREIEAALTGDTNPSPIRG